MVVNVLLFLSWCAHLVFTLTIRLIKTAKWVMDQQLSLTVGHGLSLKRIQKTSPTLVSTVHVRFHSQRLCVRLDSQVMTKLLISLVIASWFVTPLKKISTKTQQIHVLMKRLKKFMNVFVQVNQKLPIAHVACL